MSHTKKFRNTKIGVFGEKDLYEYILDEIDNYIEELDIWLKPKREYLWSYAKKIHEDYRIYYFYALLDSLNLSFSLIKCLFDFLVPANNVGFMHQMMLTEGGIIAMVVAAVFLVTFSLLAARFDKKKTAEELAQGKLNDQDIEDLKQVIADGWVYMRELLQAFKYSYKGMRNVYSLIAKGHAPTHLFTLIAAPITILVMINRLFLRKIRENRKQMMKDNQALLNKILKLEKMRAEGKIEETLYALKLKKLKAKKVAEQSAFEQRIVYPMVIFNGLSDSFYLYFGFFALAPLGVFLYPLLAVCALYSILAVVTRVFEEYQYQQTLEITQIQPKLKLLASELRWLDEKIKRENHPDKKAALMLERKALLADIERHCLRLNQLAASTDWGVIITGIKQGLAINGAMNSAVALIATILTLTSTAFPPALLGVVLGFGLLYLVIGIVYAILEERHRRRVQNNEGIEQTKEIIQSLENMDPDSETYKENLEKVSTYTAPVPCKFHSYFEVLRCIIAGPSKGQKAIDYSFNPWQEADGKGHYSDPPWMLIIAAVMGLLSAIVLGLRAFAKEFKDLPVEKEEKNEEELPSLALAEEKQVEVPCEIPADLDCPVKKPLSEKTTSLSQAKACLFFHRKIPVSSRFIPGIALSANEFTIN